MSLIDTIASMLEEKMGLSGESVGREMISDVISKHKNRCGPENETEYLNHLTTSEIAWQQLVDEIIVPETWFFRYAASFAFLQEHVRSEWLARHDNKILQVLSLPCATGEEPYSIAISLIHAQFPGTRFQIDVVDISEKVLNKAEKRCLRDGVLQRERSTAGHRSLFR